MKNFSLGSFPNTRLRRLRKSAWMRDLIAEYSLTVKDFILPLFVIEGKNQEEKIAHLPDVSRFSTDLIVKKAQEAADLGICALMLFPSIDQKLKNDNGSEAFNQNNLICRTVAAIKEKVPQIGVICDVALDPYTSHGHDGIVDQNGYVLNDVTIDALCDQALTLAKAGCDAIAPSDMMDGRVGVLRSVLDDNSFEDVAIISYAAKYASSFYGPFRHAVGSVNNLKKSDKKTYQMDFRNSDEAMREIAFDIEEGADLIIVKPALAYLDVINNAAQNFATPIIAYQVSGEYAMLKHAASAGAFDFNDVFLESLIAFKRAGASSIITYGAIEAAKLLK